MQVDGHPQRTIWLADDGWSVDIIDQRQLPARLVVARLATLDDAAEAIRAMWVRGAPLIGVTAAYGVALALRADPSDTGLEKACTELIGTRPTAVNLRWAVEDVRRALATLAPDERAAAAYARAATLADADVEQCRRIGEHGLPLITARRGQDRVDVLTHCNAGWLATVDWGTALAPVYRAHQRGVPVHVWVTETRPRNQGASLTAWELLQAGIPHTVVPDSAAGHLLQRGRVDLCIVGSDRTTARGDVCNKIGTYMEALAARAHGVPFYVALPHTTIDWTLEDGMAIPIEERDAREVTWMTGRTTDGTVATVALTPPGSPALNFAFDVTPAALVTALVTERGVCPATRDGLLGLYPERRP